jgi:hypothetical protein
MILNRICRELPFVLSFSTRAQKKKKKIKKLQSFKTTPAPILSHLKSHIHRNKDAGDPYYCKLQNKTDTYLLGFFVNLQPALNVVSLFTHPPNQKDA